MTRLRADILAAIAAGSGGLISPDGVIAGDIADAIEGLLDDDRSLDADAKRMAARARSEVREIESSQGRYSDQAFAARRMYRAIATIAKAGT